MGRVYVCGCILLLLFFSLCVGVVFGLKTYIFKEKIPHMLGKKKFSCSFLSVSCPKISSVKFLVISSSSSFLVGCGF